jgi:LuxR family transcriptional regulator, maltose regulon positive regulatory protein
MLLESLFTADPLPAKLSRPRLHTIFPRKRIFDAIAAGSGHHGIWISGPAGSGKTTAVNGYLEYEKLPRLWYTLDPGDADIVTFFHYMHRAAAAFCAAEENMPPRLTLDYLPNIDLFAKRFFEKLFSLFPRPFVLVLDDYQNITDASPLHEVLSHAISQVPDMMNLIVLSRQEPPAQLSRHRANDYLHLLGWECLRLELDETRGIAEVLTGTDASMATIHKLHAKIDGWVAGLVLLLRRGEIDGIEPKRLSNHTPQEIFDYINGELFDNLDPYSRESILRLAFLPEISIHAAHEILDIDDAEEMLDQLHRENAFLNRLVGDTVTYRFHPLMREFLRLTARRTRTPEKFATLKRQSAAVLVEDGEFEEAIRLFVEVGDIPAASALILKQAPKLAGQGRFQTLEQLIDTLPHAITDSSAWFIYWRAACRLPYAVTQSIHLPQSGELRDLFGRALDRFERDSDPVGSYLALAGILESLWMEMNELTALDPWIAKFDELRFRWGPDPPAEVLPWLAPAILGALVIRQPNHPSLDEWFKKAAVLIQTAPKAAVSIRFFNPMVFLHLLHGDLIRAEQFITTNQWSINANTSPLGTLIFNTVHSFFCWLIGRFEDSIRIADESLAFEKQHDLHLMHPHVHGAAGALSIGNTELAEEILRRVEPFVFGYGNWITALYHTVAAWIALVKRDNNRLQAHAWASMASGEKAGCPTTMPVHYHLCALAYQFAGQKTDAAKYLEIALDLSKHYHTRQIEFGCRLAKAHLALEMDDPIKANSELREAFQLGRQHNYVSAYFWCPEIMATLCTHALRNGIETDYACLLIRQRRLIPAFPPRDISNWPWPFKIRTLGGLQLEIDQKLVKFNGKMQHRPLSLLKYLVAHGGRNIPAMRLQDDLWPDLDGDRAAIAFKSALHRLRKMLGDHQVIVSSTGCISLDERLCWVDLWCLEDVAAQLEKTLEQPDSVSATQGLAQCLLNTYRGPFLPEEDAPWALHAQRMWEGRFIDLVERFTRIHANTGCEENACELIKNALAALSPNDPHAFSVKNSHSDGETIDSMLRAMKGKK